MAKKKIKNLVKILDKGFTTYKGNLEVYESETEQVIYNTETGKIERRWYIDREQGIDYRK